MKCTAKRQDGQPCKANAIKGGNVCRVHGGSAPQVKAKAMQRLLEAADPAAARLARIALETEDERVAVSAIKELLERAGVGEAQRIAVEGGIDLAITLNGIEVTDLK